MPAALGDTNTQTDDWRRRLQNHADTFNEIRFSVFFPLFYSVIFRLLFYYYYYYIQLTPNVSPIAKKKQRIEEPRRGDARFKIHVHKYCSSTREFAMSLTAIISSFWVSFTRAADFSMVQLYIYNAIMVLGVCYVGRVLWIVTRTAEKWNWILS